MCYRASVRRSRARLDEARVGLLLAVVLSFGPALLCWLVVDWGDLLPTIARLRSELARLQPLARS